jgi:hypothetical protein
METDRYKAEKRNSNPGLYWTGWRAGEGLEEEMMRLGR